MKTYSILTLTGRQFSVTDLSSLDIEGFLPEPSGATRITFLKVCNGMAWMVYSQLLYQDILFGDLPKI